MSEFRQDPLTGRWVIVAPGRAGRPRSGRDAETAAPALPAFDPSCPFCPGNEHMVPAILDGEPGEGAPGWLTRVVPNKYPAVTPMEETAGPGGGGVSLPGHGHHEVIVETPRHDTGLESLPAGQVAAVLRTCRRRQAELMRRPGIRAAVVFRNRGPLGGASLAHPHSQAIALGMVPPRIAGAEAWARAGQARSGRCVACETLERELADGRRVVEATADFVALVPFAAEAPFEQRILPRRHRASFAEADDGEIAGLAEVLGRALRRLDACLDRPPYNYVIESASADTDPAATHWSLRIVPSRSRPGGFERGADMAINTSLPEDDAGRLREAGAEA